KDEIKLHPTAPRTSWQQKTSLCPLTKEQESNISEKRHYSQRLDRHGRPFGTRPSEKTTTPAYGSKPLNASPRYRIKETPRTHKSRSPTDSHSYQRQRNPSAPRQDITTRNTSLVNQLRATENPGGQLAGEDLVSEVERVSPEPTQPIQPRKRGKPPGKSGTTSKQPVLNGTGSKKHKVQAIQNSPGIRRSYSTQSIAEQQESKAGNKQPGQKRKPLIQKPPATAGQANPESWETWEPEALFQAHAHRLTNVGFKSDAQIIIRAINGGDSIIGLFGILQDIQNLTCYLPVFSFSHIPHSENAAAGLLAKRALSNMYSAQ
ncbi:hypothetical protein HID58_069601, partial [Brassica napus]